jgi:hypothetical protein
MDFVEELIELPLRLINERDPDRTLSITNETWLGIVDLAEEYGWNPVGAIFPGQWVELEPFFSGGHYERPGNGNHDGSRLVVFEDALNLADALETAFLAYEPSFMPASFFLFEPRDWRVNLKPSIGAIQAVLELCHKGAFWIEWYHPQG